MSDIGEDEVCRLACSQTLDGYTPNPFYASGACPDYMKSECNADGSLWQKQWDMHQEQLKLFNLNRVFNASMGVPTQAVGYGYPRQHARHHQPSRGQQPQSSLLPPTFSQVFATAGQKHPQVERSNGATSTNV